MSARTPSIAANGDIRVAAGETLRIDLASSLTVGGAPIDLTGRTFAMTVYRAVDETEVQSVTATASGTSVSLVIAGASFREWRDTLSGVALRVMITELLAPAEDGSPQVATITDGSLTINRGPKTITPDESATATGPVIQVIFAPGSLKISREGSPGLPASAAPESIIVANNIAAVQSVSGNIATVTTVATNIANINAAAGAITNINAVAGSLANINTVAAQASAITTVATNITPIGTVATNIGVIASVNAMGGQIVAVANIAGDVTTVAGISGAVTTVAGNAASISTVAGGIANVNLVGNDLALGGSSLIAQAMPAATQTAADRVQTGLDRTQTGADVVSANASAQQAGASALSAGAKPIVYTPTGYDGTSANTVPLGVKSIAITTAGSGGTNGLGYAGGTTGTPPSGFAWTYDIVGGSAVNPQVVNPGLTSSVGSFALTFPGGSLTGSPAATATTGSTIPDNGSYVTPSSTLGYMALWKKTVGSTVPAPFNDQFGNQILVPTNNALTGLTALNATIRVYQAGQLDQSGNQLPGFLICDQATGKFFFGVTFDGKTRVARNGWDEVATLKDIPLGLVNYPTGTPLLVAGTNVGGSLMLGAEPDGTMKLGRLLVARDPRRMAVEFNPIPATFGGSAIGADAMLRALVKSPGYLSEVYFEYTWYRSTATLSLGFWYLATIYKCVRLNNSFEVTRVAPMLGGGASGFGVWAEGTTGAIGSASVTNGSNVVTVTSITSGPGLAVGQLLKPGPGSALGSGGTPPINPSGVIITGQLTGTTGGIGTYTMASAAAGSATGVYWSDGTSIDKPGEVRVMTTPANFVGLPAHGNCYPVPLGPRNVTNDPLILLDTATGMIELTDFTKKQRFYATELRMFQNTKSLRSRATPLASTTNGFVHEFEDYRLNAQDQLRHSCVSIFQEQFTGTGYYPLLTLAQTFVHARRDYINGAAGPEFFTLPTQMDNLTVADNVPGVGQLIYSSGTEVCEVNVGTPKMWAPGNTPWGPMIRPGFDNFQIKRQVDQNKAYWGLGSTAYSDIFGNTLGQMAANEVWKREYSMKFTA